MKRINTVTSVGNRFVDGNKALGRKATQFSAEWCNMVQEELCNLLQFLTGAGPTGASEDEIAAAFAAGVASLSLAGLSIPAVGGISVNVNSNGVTYTKRLSNSVYTVSMSDSGVIITYSDSSSRQKVIDLDSGVITVSESYQGLTNTTTIDDEKVQIVNQSRIDGDIVETKTVVDAAKVQSLTFRIGNDDNYQDVTFDLNESSASYGCVKFGALGSGQYVHFPAICSWGNSAFKNDVDIDGDVDIAKTLKVHQLATFDVAISAPNTPTTVTDIGSPDDDGNYFAFQLSSAWTTGQKKMIYNTTASDILQSVYLASNASGSSHQLTTVTFPARRYLELVYSGKTVTNGDNTFGVFFVGA